MDEAELDLDAPIVVLSGKSGQGKSTVFRAIDLCWTGRKLSDKYTEYIKQGRDAATIDLDAIVGKSPISFHVELHHKGFTPFTREIDYQGKKYKNTDATALIASLDVEYFFEILYMMQGPDSDVVSMSPARRSDYVQRLLNFDFSDKLNKIRADLNDAFARRDELNREKRDAEVLNEASQKRLEQLKPPTLTEADVLELKNERLDIERRVDEASKTNDVWNNLNEAIAFQKNKLLSLRESKSSLEKEAFEVEVASKSISEKDEQLKSLLSSNLEYLKELNEATKELREYDAILKRFDEELAKLKAAKDSEGEENREIYRWKASLDEGTCPHCGQKTERHARAELIKRFGTDDIEKLIDDNKSEIAELTNREAEQKRDRADSAKKREHWNEVFYQSKQKVATCEESTERLRKQIEKLSVGNYEERLLTLEEKIKKLDEDLEENGKYLEFKEHELSEIEKVDVDPLKRRIREIDSIIMDRNLALKRYAEEKKLETEALATRAIRIQEIDGEVGKVNADASIKEQALKLIDRGLTNYLVVKTCENLENAMNEQIGVVFQNYRMKLERSKSGVKFFYTKNASLDKKSNNSWLDARMSCGFERQLLSVSFRIALCSLYGLPWCMLDECDGAGDPESSEKLYEFILSCGLFDSMFIISHKEEVKELVLDSNAEAIAYEAIDGRYELITNQNDDD